VSEAAAVPVGAPRGTAVPAPWPAGAAGSAGAEDIAGAVTRRPEPTCGAGAS